MIEDVAWHRFRAAGAGVLRVTLLFGSAAFALALILVAATGNHARADFSGSLVQSDGGGLVTRSVDRR